jgi:HPt (histidine-containing phosphotransfer) domain-containing protein
MFTHTFVLLKIWWGSHPDDDSIFCTGVFQIMLFPCFKIERFPGMYRLVLSGIVDTDVSFDYTIEVHALKSSALLIGAPGLSEAAKELEMYGNAQNLAALEEKTGPVLAMYRSLKSLLCPYVEDNESSKKEVSSDDWITVLEQMHQCVEQFDMDGVDHAMETMDTFQTPDKLKDLMEQLRVCVADVEMEEIMKLTDTMVNLLQ